MKTEEVWRANKLRCSITTQLMEKNLSVPWKVLSEKHGFELTLLAVDHPGQEQKVAVAANPSGAPRLCDYVGLGCHEPGCHPGSGQYPFPDGKLYR